MSKEADAAVRAQFERYGLIARFYDNLKKMGAANITIGVVEARLQALDSNWAKFEAQHDELAATCWEALSGHDYVKKDLLGLTEETYLKQKGLFLDTLSALKNKSGNELSTADPSVQKPPRTTLPRIQLPQFSGQYEDWPSFRDLFQSLITKDVATSQVEKLHYLKTCLKGEAELLVRSLPTTGENFSRAWQALTDYYENKRLLVRSYLSRFTELQKLKGESASELRKLLHCVRSTVGSLESIGRPITNSEDLFVHLTIELLDPRSRREWETSISDSTEPPSYTALQQFLDRRLHTLESLLPAKADASAKLSSGSGRQTRVLHSRKSENKRGRCSLCSQEHYIMFCDDYKAMAATDRKQHVDANNLCFNCLGKHKASECKSKGTCSTCSARHHSLLHEAYQNAEVAKSAHTANRPAAATSAVLLATARVRVADRFGVRHAVRALVDQGSETSLVAESLAQRLGLPRGSTSVAIYGIGGKRTGVARGIVSLELSSLRGESPMTVSALILPQLTLYDGGARAERRAWAHLDGLELADPDYHSADSVELLLGADVVADILLQGLRRGRPQEPVAQQTTLGWILSGSVGVTSSTGSARTFHCVGGADFTAMVQRFWEQEEANRASTPLSSADREAEDHYVRTHYRNNEGRYVVRLPLKSAVPDLTATRHTAARLLGRMERRFLQDDHLRQLYTAFMREYEALGHMSLASTPKGVPRGRNAFFPTME